jgi:hypothetical protein
LKHAYGEKSYKIFKQMMTLIVEKQTLFEKNESTLKKREKDLRIAKSTGSMSPA